VVNTKGNPVSFAFRNGVSHSLLAQTRRKFSLVIKPVSSQL